MIPVHAYMENTNSRIFLLLSAHISEVAVLPVLPQVSLKSSLKNSLEGMCLFLSLNFLQERQWGLKTLFVISVWQSDSVNLN